MSIIKQMKTLATLALVFGISPTASAIILDFDSAAQSTFQTGAYVEDGFQITRLDGHYDIFGGGTGGTNYFNIDTVGDATYGLTSTMRIESLSGIFSLNSLDVILANGLLDGTLTSSNGGSATLSVAGNWTFGGATWTDISWFEFSVGPDYGGLAKYAGIDTIDVSVSVPEPTILMLLSLGFALIGFSSKKRAA